MSKYSVIVKDKNALKALEMLAREKKIDKAVIIQEAVLEFLEDQYDHLIAKSRENEDNLTMEEMKQALGL